MSIMIREYAGYSMPEQENFTLDPLNLSEGLNDFDPLSPGSLMVDIEGIHEDVPTRNFTRYKGEALRGSIPSWTKPYKRPLIMHHNEKDGKIIGRVVHAEYLKKSELSGTGALLFTVNVPDKDGIEQIEDGRLLTVSIGVIAHDVRCSCCGHNIAEYGECPDHDRGQEYNGEICYWDIYSMEAKELSYVIVPSDIYAKNVRVYKAKAATQHISESYTTGGKKKMNLTEAEIKAIQDELTLEKEKATALETSLTEAQEKVATLELAATTTATELSEAQNKLEEATQSLSEKESAIQEEKNLREAAEASLIELQTKSKKDLAESLSALRKAAGKVELEESVLLGRSVESIKNSIEDLRLELSEGSKLGAITKVADPTISESKKENVKKENVARNINLEEGLANLFTGLAGRKI